MSLPLEKQNIEKQPTDIPDYALRETFDIDIACNEVMKNVQEMLLEAGSLPPLVFLFTDHGIGVGPLFIDKDSWAMALKAMVSQLDAFGVILVMECWISKNPKDGVRPSDDPERAEAISVCGSAPFTPLQMVLQEIVRAEDGTITFTAFDPPERVESYHFEGLWDDRQLQ